MTHNPRHQNAKSIATVVYAVLDIAQIVTFILMVPAILVLASIMKGQHTLNTDDINLFGASVVGIGLLFSIGKLWAALRLIPKLLVFVRLFNNVHYSLAIVLLLHLVLWVFDPKNPIYESRTALLAFLVAIFEYVRRRSNIPEDPRTRLLTIPDDFEA